MIVTHVHIVLPPEEVIRAGHLRAYVNLVLDDSFCVKGLKVIEGPSGLFLQMPDRPATTRCPACGGSAEVVARYCSRCGGPVAGVVKYNAEGHPRARHDVAHPIRTDLREHIESRVLEAYHTKMARVAKVVAS